MHEFLYFNAAFGLRTVKRQPKAPAVFRVTPAMHQDLTTIARTNGLTVSDIVRLAISRELPAMKSQAGQLSACL